MGLDKRSNSGCLCREGIKMIRISQIKLSAFVPESEVLLRLKEKAAKKLKTNIDTILEIKIDKRSLDARIKDNILYVYTVDVMVKNEKTVSLKDKDICVFEPQEYHFPYKNDKEPEFRPVIVGFGPAGIFCAYMLAQAGFAPIVLERGKRVEERTVDVEEFWAKGKLLTDSNVSFGEGGAGTFSDGKLNTAVKDKKGRNREVLRLFVKYGAPESILYDNKPHIGTDVLMKVVANLRNAIIEMGGDIYYETKADSFIAENGEIASVKAGKHIFNSKAVAIAIGHSARDTFEILNKCNVSMTPKAFAVGMRVMHSQDMIDKDRYGVDNSDKKLPVSDYKLTYTSQNGRGVYSFCMCPGGYVVNASSREQRTAVNGMSYHDRNSSVANSAIVVQVTPDDYKDKSVLGGVAFQEELERKAYEAGDGKIPVQRYGDFRHKVNASFESKGLTDSVIACKGETKSADLTGIMPQACNAAFVEGMEHFGKIIKEFNDGNVMLAGIESRTSSPVRIERDENGISVSVNGLFPCGEGAGYAGGITSAAMDGIYIAECMAEYILNNY